MKKASKQVRENQWEVKFLKELQKKIQKTNGNKYDLNAKFKTILRGENQRKALQ